ncbi:MAG TPA: hypothetical protein P5328_00160 [Candidatus Paceibacterota bacterium]|nr:hypothetical protein [Candidatus Paceibacterota bacterium]HRZ34258.1 hypothetical protein [Candidatus Paceibacterota bacterium]
MNGSRRASWVLAIATSVGFLAALIVASRVHEESVATIATLETSVGSYTEPNTGVLYRVTAVDDQCGLMILAVPWSSLPGGIDLAGRRFFQSNNANLKTGAWFIRESNGRDVVVIRPNPPPNLQKISYSGEVNLLLD